ncbi:MAG: VWA domain-containing protein [Phycisphaerae bacterium]|nr:VWA domain-containing protein [Phycisphaerae bacterium]
MGLFDQLGDLVLRHGQKALDAMAGLNFADAAGLRGLLDEGMLAVEAGRYSLTPRGLAQLERSTLESVLDELDPKRDPSAGSGRGDDLLSDRDLRAALRLALTPGAACPLHVERADLNRFIAQCRRTLSVVLLLDMSYSMGQFGRFHQAKRAALALQSLARDRFADDSVDVIGFYSLAEPIARERLPLLMPMPVAIADRKVDVRVPLAEASQAPQHFTNLHMAVQLAGQVLAKRPGENKAVFIVTDGEPTAYVDDGRLVLRYPPDGETAAATLAEAQSLTKSGVRLTSFALIDDYSFMDWVDFIDRLTRLTRGGSFYCGSENLAACVLESYIASKKA